MTGALDNTFWKITWLFPSSSRQSLIPHFDKVASTSGMTVYTAVHALSSHKHAT